MTLVLSVRSRDTLWLVVDRRLSYGSGRPPEDNAVKVMELQTLDGVGLVAYAGLGATPRGTQPSQWMSAVLRGRGGLTFEQALGVLSAAANKELPRRLARIPGGAHFIIVPAFIKGVGARLYSIDNVVDPNTRKHWYRYTSHQRPADQGATSPRLVVAGTGGIYLGEKDRSWQRPLLRLVQAHDRGKVSDHVIADELARLNYKVHHAVRDGSVGPRCIVVWRRRQDARPGPGGGDQFYTGIDRDENTGPPYPAMSETFPSIYNGMDMGAVIGATLAPLLPRLVADPNLSTGAAFNLAKDEMEQLLANLPDEPDEKLR